jgi:mono/diheme cytochrome c family protein
MNLQRLLIERMEHRIIVGTVAFLGIMVLVGWIAINENGRMQAFQRQYAARAIERGAELYNGNCSTCHGSNGYGGGRAPALNSPYLFGHDFLAETRRERAALEFELTQETTTEERAAAIDTRLAELEAAEAPLRQQMQAAIDRGYDPDAPSRLANVGWGGSLDSFVYTTLVHGRPTSIS